MSEVKRYFEYADYAVFGTVLVVSALVGVYFAFFAKVKQNTTTEYLMGGKTMGIFPISMSLIASDISGISVLGIPAEMYTFGTQYWMTIVSKIFVALIMAYAILPVFYHLQITSSYEYLSLRFNNGARLFGTILFLLKMLLYIPIVIYVPALAFSQVTGINLHLVTPMVCLVCIFYTTLGGLKAVVWTDTIQTIIMFFALLITVVVGTHRAGGFKEVWRRNVEGGRVQFFNMDPDPTVRHSFWTVTIGNFFYFMASCSINQAMVQRCLAMPTLKSSKITMGILVAGLWVLISMCCYIGMVIYAFYQKCDPVTRGRIRKSDQLLPYFVMDTVGDMPGLPGMFVSGVFSAALSSMSTGLNSMAGVIFEDLIKPRLKKPLTEAQASCLMKIMVAVIGAVCVCLVFVVEKLGTLIQAAGSIGAITAGPMLGVFLLGMFFPNVTTKGALTAGILSSVFIASLSIGSQTQIAHGRIRFPHKPISIEGCDADWLAEYLSITLNTNVVQEPAVPVFVLYRLSYMYYTPLGTVGTILLGLVVSFCTGRNRKAEVNRNVISPVVWNCMCRPEASSNGATIMEMKNGANSHN